MFEVNPYVKVYISNISMLLSEKPFLHIETVTTKLYRKSAKRAFYKNIHNLV